MHTSVGKMLEAIDNDPVSNDFASFEEAALLRDQIRAIVSNAAHYVTDDKVLKLIGQDKVQKGFIAMVQAGIRDLPHDPILIEFRDPTSTGVSFVRLQSKPMVPVKIVDEDLRGDIYAYPVGFDPDPRMPAGEGYLVSTVDPTDPVIIDFEDNGERPYTVYVGRSMDSQQGAKQRLGLDVAEAMSIAMLMLNTRGIEKVHVDTGRLNKARAKSPINKKPRIEPYTVLRIGHIYDAQGNAHSVQGSGRHMPMHWRAGHVRNVRYGPRKGPELHRPVFIAPILVNYEGEVDIPVPKHEVRL